MNELTALAGGAGRRKPRIAVVFGGRSSEHAISCVTAGGVLRALDHDAYDIVPIGITTEGRWVLQPADTSLAIEGGQLPEVDAKGRAVVLAEGTAGGELVAYEPGEIPTALGQVDVVFPLLHGPYGEDGTIQGLLEMAGVRYVGAGVLASAVSMDKHFTNMVFQGSGLPVTPYAVLKPGEWARDPVACRETVEAMGYPVFVKPARGGSSIGISKVADASALDAAVENALAHDPKVVVEKSVEGARELECGVLQGLGGTRPHASQVAEIFVPEGRDLYDFESKYLPEEAAETVVPADLPATVTATVRAMAVSAFEAVGAEGLARVDFFLCDDGTLLVNEINTMPGFTPQSMFPRMWEASGVDYPKLLDWLIRLALERPTGLR